jgi:hypothetical protein
MWSRILRGVSLPSFFGISLFIPLCSSRCLNNIDRASCPLCRTYFDQQTTVKLHVDLDSSSSDSSSSAIQEARRLQAAIASVANEGTTEPRLRQLIAEGTAFLTSQPRELVSKASSMYIIVVNDETTVFRA